MRRWFAIAAVVWCPALAWGQGRTGGGTQAQQTVKRADRAFAAKRLAEAVRLYDEALRYDRNLPAAYEKLAIACYALRRHRMALARLNVCLQVAPKDVKCHMWRGLHLLRIKRRAAGIRALRTAVTLNWRLPLAMRQLGRHYYRRGQWRRAEKAWWTFLKFRDRSWSAQVDFVAYHYLGRIYLRQRRYPAAQTAFTKALKLRKAHKGVTLGLARAYLGRGYFNAALNLLWPLRRIAKKRPVVHLYLARCFHRMRRKAQALAQLKRYGRRVPGDVRRLILLGDIHFAHREFGPALAAYRQATVQAPASMEAKVKYAEALLRLKRATEAHTLLKAAARVRPRNARVLKALGETLLALRKAKAAVAAFGRLLAVRPRDATAAALRGDAHRLAGQLDQAIADYERARRWAPKDWRARHGLIRALTRRARSKLSGGNTRAALSDLKRAHRLDPGRVATALNLAIANLQAGRHPSAARVLAPVYKRLPRSYAVNRLLGRLYYATGKLARAKAHYVRARAAARRLPTRFQAAIELELGGLLAKQRDLDTAVAVLKSGLTHAAGRPVLKSRAAENLAIALLDRGYQHLAKGRSKRAVADLERARSHAKHLGGGKPQLARFLLALAYLQAGRWSKAAGAFRALSGKGQLAQVLRPPFHQLGMRYFTAYTQYRRGGYEVAARALKRLRRQVKGKARRRLTEIIRSAYEMRAAQHLGRRKPLLAVTLYRRARRLSGAGRHNRAVAWYQSGKRAQALKAWKRGRSAAGLCNVATHHDNAGQPQAAYRWYKKCAARGGATAGIKKRMQTLKTLFGYR